ncbi:hypothetical protein CMO88_03815 [Candidatus Woesearchaeota archaeon]|nr:hypothetical protein [Candidatus Woesearchaeota archaeon]|tara:strand:- start:28113 stop:28358 length:246 start_codon:yes stop_codon:yes gene_type:complete
MAYYSRVGPGSIIATILFVPLLIFMIIFIPALIIVILFIAVTVGIAAILAAKVKNIGKKTSNDKTAKVKKGKVIDAEYKIK